MSDAAAPTDPVVDPDSPDFVYDEFSMFHENCAEYDLPFDGPPTVARVEHQLADGRTMRA